MPHRMIIWANYSTDNLKHMLKRIQEEIKKREQKQGQLEKAKCGGTNECDFTNSPGSKRTKAAATNGQGT